MALDKVKAEQTASDALASLREKEASLIQAIAKANELRAKLAAVELENDSLQETNIGLKERVNNHEG